MANKFNSYFVNIGRSLAEGFEHSDNFMADITETQMCSFSFSNMNFEQVKTIFATSATNCRELTNYPYLFLKIIWIFLLCLLSIS